MCGKYCVALILLIIAPCVISKKKASLAFVIDSTGSMAPEINAVVKRTNEMFDAVLNSKTSLIDNFVLVTFKDPDVEPAFKTQCEEEFKQALEDISVFGGVDCPEASIGGIEVAINASHPNSFVYVFTDAAAKDYEKYEAVQALALDKSTQVTFLLTGICDECTDCPNYVVYHKFANTTGGQVFNVNKGDVNSIMNYVIDSIRNQQCLISHQHFMGSVNSPSTYNHPFTVDESIKELTLSLAGQNADLKIYDSNNNLVPSQTLVKLGNSTVVKVENVIPGKYIATLTVSKGEANLNIKAPCTFSFEHGFSENLPTAIQGTSKSPVIGQATFLAIKLDEECEEVKLKSVQIRDLNNNILMEIDIQISNEEERFYVTDKFVPPDTIFKISVKGVVTCTNDEIIRHAIVSIEPLKNNFPAKILEIKAEEIANVRKVQCLVEGYPKPSISWTLQEGVNLGPEKITDINFSTVKGVMEFNIKDSIKLQCTANNNIGSDTASYTLELTGPEIDKSILEYVKKKGESVDIECRVIKGNPEPTLSWSFIRQNGGQYFELNSKEATLRLCNVDVDDAGVYMCNANNDIDEDSLFVDLSVQYPPYIEPKEKSVIAYIDQNVVLDCVTHGLPIPSVQWFVNETEIVDGNKYRIHTNNSLSFVTNSDDKGIYKCKATNDLGTNSTSYNVSVYSLAPIIEELDVTHMTVDGRFTIECLVSGREPDIVWKNQRGNKFTKAITNTKIDKIYKSVIQVRKTADDYITCSAKNEFGEMAVPLPYPGEKPVIYKTVPKSIVKNVNEAADLFCRIKKGIPKPNIVWFFMVEGGRNYVKLKITDEKLHKENLRRSDAGRYYCRAVNFKGSDRLITKLSVNMAPQILPHDKSVVSQIGEKTTLDCVVKAFPPPSVRWYFNDKEIVNGARYHFHNNHSISFEGKILDNGVFKCVVSNIAGTTSAAYEVKINSNAVVPVSIKPPLKTTFHLLKGDSQSLDCEAMGTPEPTIEWVFKSFNSVLETKMVASQPKKLTLASLKLNDAGTYTCIATRGNENARLEYTVYVEAVPWIEDTTPKDLTAVEQDMTFRMTCPAFGIPPPKIRWVKDDYENIVDGTFYYMENNLLVIKRVDIYSEGEYKCIAENTHGTAEKTYFFKVLSEPDINAMNEDICIIEELPTRIKCKGWNNDGILDKKVNWYKKGVGWIDSPDDDLRLTGDLDDGGTYTCRGTFQQPISVFHYQINISVCYPPKFFIPDAIYARAQKRITNNSTLDCYATSHPPPMVIWYKNGNIIPQTSMSPKPIGPGLYQCEVSNSYGIISRKFDVTFSSCNINVHRDFSYLPPLLLNNYKLQPSFNVIDDTIHIPENEEITLYCPSSIIELGGRKITKDFLHAKCPPNAQTLTVDGYPGISYKDISCSNRAITYIRRVLNYCTGKGNSILLSVGYSLGRSSIGVYDICFDLNEQKPVYSKSALHASVDHLKREYPYETNLKYNFYDYDSLYECDRQHYNMTTAIRKGLGDTSCCFHRRPLLNAKDIFPSYEMVAFNNINIAPQWSSCDSTNWIEIEKRVRDKARQVTVGKLIVWTGVADNLELKSSFGQNTLIKIHDKHHRSMNVARYFWKIVEDRHLEAGIAIIQFNIPKFNGDAEPYVLCKDVCDKRPWLMNPDWKDVSKGYTYCCSVQDFLKAFDDVTFLQKMPKRLL